MTIVDNYILLNVYIYLITGFQCLNMSKRDKSAYKLALTF